MKIPFKKSQKGIRLKIKVEPRSSRKGISGIVGDTVKIKVHAPPVEGAANNEIIEILSQAFQIKKTAIKIITGHYAREKIVELEGQEVEKKIRLCEKG
jgi:uncharacterized protein (TIGR00251 family)